MCCVLVWENRYRPSFQRGRGLPRGCFAAGPGHCGWCWLDTSFQLCPYCQNCSPGLIPTSVLEVTVRGVFCSSLLFHSRKGDVSDALELPVQTSLGIAELLRDSELLLTLPKTMDFPIPTGTLFLTARKNPTTLQKYERGLFNSADC